MEPIGREPDPQAVRALRIAFSPTLGYAKVAAPVERVVAAAVDRLTPVFPSLITVADGFPDFSEIHRAIFFAGLSASHQYVARPDRSTSTRRDQALPQDEL
jgi:hypothetical protein